MRVSTVQVFPAEGESITATVSEVGNEPARLSFDTTSFIDEVSGKATRGMARQVHLSLDPEDAARLRLDSRVRVIARIAIPPSVTWVPAHYVVRENDADTVINAGDGHTHTLTGFRVGDTYIVTAGLEPGMRVRATEDVSGDAAACMRFEGEVRPGPHTELVGPPRTWGRIKSLLPDGSRVEKGDWIMTLHNPFVEERKKRSEHDKRLAQQRYLEAAEERRVKAIAANMEHETRVLAERKARIVLRALAEPDPVAEISARNTFESAQIAGDDARQAFEVMRKADVFSATRLREAAFDMKSRRVERDKRHLGLVRVLRARDWLKQAQAQTDWTIASRELGVRDLVLQLARQEEEVARLKSRLELDANLRDHGFAERFERARVVHSPAGGRLLYKSGFSWVKEGIEKFGEGSEVWGGRPYGIIMDMRTLTFRCNLPETLYHRVRPGATTTIVFPHLDGLELEARATDVGRSFFVPKPMEEETGEESVSVRKVFTVTYTFSPPEHYRDQLMPGTKGQVVLGRGEGGLVVAGGRGSGSVLQ